ncbi:putative ABC transporter [Polychaeton citri CBS 116435]|uniref:ABC transporter n=1 Tax=Polychaeton citri CBS 116435 TaxID=1314669 RepID=A0A9P4Q0U8_9PEZI|nr:putative ABC transporter [Polychaeton citri CBS 116435]
MSTADPALIEATQVVHYVTPWAVLVCFFGCQCVDGFLLQRPKKHSTSRLRRFSAICLSGVLFTTEIGQGITYLIQAAKQPEWYASQDSIVYVLFSFLAYGTLATSLLETKFPIWRHFAITWTIALICEIFITSLALTTPKLRSSFELARLCCSILRSFVLVTLLASQAYFAITLRQRWTIGNQPFESQALLGNGHTNARQNTLNPQSSDGQDTDEESDFDSDSEDPEADKKLKRDRKKRLQEYGNWAQYLKEYKIFVPLIWPSGNRVVQACLAVVGVAMLAQRVLVVLIPRQLGILTDQLTHMANTGIMPWKALGLWALFYFLGSGAGITNIRQFATLPVQNYAYKAIGSYAFQHIMMLSMNFHNEKNSGELIDAIEKGQSMEQVITLIFFEIVPTVTDLMVAIGYVYSLFDIYMMTIVLFVTVSYIAIGTRLATWSVKPRRSLNDAVRTNTKNIVEAVTNWTTVSHFHRMPYECRRVDESLDKINQAEWNWQISMYSGRTLQAAIMVVGRVGAATLAAYRISQGTARVGQFVTLMSYWGSIEEPLTTISGQVRYISRMLTDSERLLQLLQTKPTVVERDNPYTLYFKSGEVRFDHVGFSYDARKPTIQDMSFTVKPGQTVALVGETGGGKSTLLKLLYRYFDVNDGSIRIDGQDIRDVTLESLRNSFGMVPQDPSLFNITIMENIRYARLDASDEEVKDACRAAAIHDKIESFPDRYKSQVGERGVKLSGGEMQRVAIARAILRQPKIVLLDEATSMIDAETEALIQQALKRLTAGRTTFVVAHRLSTIQHADVILVVGDGKIVESGSHEELFERKGGKYAALWSRQLNKTSEGLRRNAQGGDEDLLDLSDDTE